MSESVSPQPKIVSVSTLLRVMYSDGTVAAAMMPPQSLGPATSELLNSAGAIAKTCELLEEQHQVLINHLRELGPVALYEQANAEAAARREHVNQQADIAREKHRVRGKEADETNIADSGTAESGNEAGPGSDHSVS